MKKKILYIAAIIICLSIITGGTFAFYTTSDTARNVITTDGVEVAVVEQQLVNGAPQDYPAAPIPVMPATTVSKIVSVESSGEPVWVRMNYSVTVFDSKGKEMDIPADELAKVIIIEPDGEGWTYNGGWWYYESALKAGERTQALFDSIRFAGPEMDNKYQSCTVYVDVTAQAVQQKHNGESVMEALGWPAS